MKIPTSSPLHASQGHLRGFWPYPLDAALGTCLNTAPCAYGGQFRPPGQLVQETATGIRPASILAGMPNADPSPIGGSLRSRRSLFRLISAPRILWGAEMAGLL